jgi:hypothetical protein
VSPRPAKARLRVGWYAITDTVVIGDLVTEDEVEIPRSEWVRFVSSVKSGELDEPWMARSKIGPDE